jgi:archaellum component FlaC
MAINVEQEIRELKARLEKHDTTLAPLMGQFEFISNQLNAVQRFMQAKFDAIDKRFDGMEKRFDKIESDVGTLREDLPGIGCGSSA